MKTIEQEISELLDKYSEDVQKTADKTAAQSAREAVKELKQTSPQRSGSAYARDWAVKADKNDHSFYAHNRKHYQLTHLLEYGHEIISHGKSAGRTSGNNHIERAAKNAGKDFEEKTKRLLNDL